MIEPGCPDCGERAEAHWTSDGTTFKGCPFPSQRPGPLHDGVTRVSIRCWRGIRGGRGRMAIGINPNDVIAILDEFASDGRRRVLNMTSGGEWWLSVEETRKGAWAMSLAEQHDARVDVEYRLGRKVQLVQTIRPRGIVGKRP